MYEILNGSSGKVVGVKVSGRLSADDIKALGQHLETVIKETGGPIRLLADMTDYDGMDFAAFWEDLAFSLTHMRDFERVVAVGDQTWIEWWIKAANPLVKAEARHFPPDQIDAAWAWLREA